MKHLLVVAMASLVLAGCGTGQSGSGNGGETASSTTSGVKGTTSMGPTCPVESAASPCPTQPVVAHLVVRNSSGSVVADTDSSADGVFRMDLAPGSYDVTATVTQGVPMQQEKTAKVAVAKASYTKLDLIFDSGIRAGGPAPVT